MFEHLRSYRIASLNLEAREYRHAGTGARHLHLAAGDDNNAFMVAFRTLPEDSTGVAHILEHTVLCGSERYPVRDPFFLMTRRSLNTFMNAFTGSDWTAYVFASQNRKDFDNLMQVYLDAVFFPTLSELDFAQEGHRLDLEAPLGDPKGALVYKGVVYNEMRGALSSPTARLWHALAAELYPTTTYHHNSGGDPEEIPRLTLEGLRAFHRRHYHPSNCLFGTYGDFDPREHQARFHALALSRFGSRPPGDGIGDERRYSAPRALSLPYAANDAEDTRDKTHIVLGWLLGRTQDLRSVLEMHLLSGVLLNNSAAPLRHALETTALGAAPSELCGLDSGHREAVFACGLEGSDPERAQAVEELCLTVIREVVDKGVDAGLVSAVLHQMELDQREISGGSYPYGLQLLSAAIPMAMHGGDPIAALDLDAVIEALRAQALDPAFVPGLARRWLLDNPHRVRVVMTPDPELNARQSETMRERLAERRAALSASELERIVAENAALAARQEHAGDASILPKVGIADVPPDIRVPESRDTDIAGLPVTWFDRGTNGIVYIDLFVEVPALAPADLDRLRIYTGCLTEVGCGGRDYREAQARQAAVSGGVGAQCSVRALTDDLGSARLLFRLSANCLARNQQALAGLLAETFFEAHFDELERLGDLIAQMRAGRESGVTDHGHALAMAAASAGIGPAADLAQRWDGLPALQALKRLDQGLADPAQRALLGAGLAALHHRFLTAPRRLLVVGEGRYHEPLAGALEAFAGPFTNSSTRPGPVAAHRVHEAWLTSTETSFCARAYPAVPVGHPDAAPLSVLGRFLQNGYLHRAIREQGGAYGSGAGYDGDTGAFRFYSYRDPRLGETLDDFDASLAWLKDHRHGPEQLEEAILGIIGGIDRPSSPAGEAIKTFVARLNGRTPEFRRRLRQQVLAVGVDDLRRVAERYLVPERAGTAVVTDRETLARYRTLGLEARSLS
jgi:Zn-dependent M16 (insulinase) family peptidase